MNIAKAACAVCEGRETVDSVVLLQLSANNVTSTSWSPAGVAPGTHAGRLPLCAKHYREAERALDETKRVQSGPVTINVPGLKIGGRQGRI
jgi:hypothetical protein